MGQVWVTLMLGVVQIRQVEVAVLVRATPQMLTAVTVETLVELQFVGAR